MENKTLKELFRLPERKCGTCEKTYHNPDSLVLVAYMDELTIKYYWLCYNGCWKGVG